MRRLITRLKCNVRQREKKFTKLSLAKVNPVIWKLRKEKFKLKSKFEIIEKLEKI